jgi:hypothetical protein
MTATDGMTTATARPTRIQDADVVPAEARRSAAMVWTTTATARSITRHCALSTALL